MSRESVNTIEVTPAYTVQKGQVVNFVKIEMESSCHNFLKNSIKNSHDLIDVVTAFDLYANINVMSEKEGRGEFQLITPEMAILCHYEKTDKNSVTYSIKWVLSNTQKVATGIYFPLQYKESKTA